MIIANSYLVEPGMHDLEELWPCLWFPQIDIDDSKIRLSDHLWRGWIDEHPSIIHHLDQSCSLWNTTDTRETAEYPKHAVVDGPAEEGGVEPVTEPGSDGEDQVRNPRATPVVADIAKVPFPNTSLVLMLVGWCADDQLEPYRLDRTSCRRCWKYGKRFANVYDSFPTLTKAYCRMETRICNLPLSWVEAYVVELLNVPVVDQRLVEEISTVLKELERDGVLGI